MIGSTCAHLDKVLRDPVVEVRVELVDNRLIFDDREETYAEAHHANKQQCQARQNLCPTRARVSVAKSGICGWRGLGHGVSPKS